MVRSGGGIACGSQGTIKHSSFNYCRNMSTVQALAFDHKRTTDGDGSGERKEGREVDGWIL